MKYLSHSSTRFPFRGLWRSLTLVSITLLLSGAEVFAQNDGQRLGSDWPGFLGSSMDSKSIESGILKDWTDGKLSTVWQRPLQESYGIGSTADGRFFQLDREDDDCVLLCLNAETGKEIWRYAYPTEYADRYGYNGGPRCSPVIDGNRVYTFGVEGMLNCVNAETGKLIWSRDTATDFEVVQNFFGVGSTPVVEADLLIAMIGGAGSSKDVEQSGIVAFDKHSGETRYGISKELASYASLKTASIAGRRWCFAFTRGGLVAFEPATGVVDFEFPWRAKIRESVNASVPCVFDGNVFISETYGPGSCLLKVKPGGYDLVWQDEPRDRNKAMQTHWNTAIEHKGFIYGSSGRHSSNAELRCIRANTGEVMWSEPDLARCSLMYVDDHFVCLSEYGRLILIEATHEKFAPVTEADFVNSKSADAAQTGDAKRKKSPLNYPCWAAPILSHGLLYVRGDDRLLCLELIPPQNSTADE